MIRTEEKERKGKNGEREREMLFINFREFNTGSFIFFFIFVERMDYVQAIKWDKT